ncbi:MAG: hypothetical protein VW080_00525 [Flavobacteriaceae bacterium]
MKINYLFPYKFKRLGLWFLFPASIFGLIITLYEWDPALLDWKVPAIFIDQFFGKNQLIGMVNNNVLNEIVGVLILVSSILVAFSKERVEDEYIAKLRLESLVWAVYVNYAILLVSFLFIFDMSFLWVMIFNMFTILWFFIIRFSWLKSKLKQFSTDE